MGWTVRGSNPGRGKRFFSYLKHPDQLSGPLSILFNGYRGSDALGVKRPSCDADRSPPCIADVRNEWNFYLCYSYMPSWHGQGQLYLQIVYW